MLKTDKDCIAISLNQSLLQFSSLNRSPCIEYSYKGEIHTPTKDVGKKMNNVHFLAWSHMLSYWLLPNARKHQHYVYTKCRLFIFVFLRLYFVTSSSVVLHSLLHAAEATHSPGAFHHPFGGSHLRPECIGGTTHDCT